MARGFLTGALSGTVIAAGLGAVASVIAPPPNQPSQTIVAGFAPAPTVAPALTETESPRASVAQDTRPATPSVVLGLTPAADTLTELEAAIRRPGVAPNGVAAEIASVLEMPGSPEDLALEGAIAPVIDDPVTRSSQTMALGLPPLADRFEVRTQPAELPVEVPSQPVVVRSELGGDADEAFRTASLELGAFTDIAAPTLLAPAPTRVAQPGSVAQETLDARQVSIRPESIAAAAEAPAALRPLPPPGPPTAVNRPQSTQSESLPAGTRVAQAAQAAEPSPRPLIGKPAVSLTDRNNGVVVNRLGNSAASETPDAEAETTAATDGAVEQTDLRPVERYKRAFENADGKPLMSIVLIDNGASAIEEGTDIADLRDFPYPLSFAVDSALPDAQERIAMYRSEGFEVLGMIDLPPGAQPTDAETTMGVLLPQMGEIVGVLEGPGAGLQESREVSDQVTAILAESGHGLVAQAKGLNTMPNLARKQGVPAAPVFRDFDGKGQGERVIRRFLDQAAFKAGQEGAVIMLGRLQAETIGALLVWGLQDRAGQVALAPVSAVLLRDDAP